MDRFLITGALGCIGAWTVASLVRAGVPVVAFDLGADPGRLRLIMTPAELARVTFVQADLTDLDALERALDEHAITHVIHLAALQLPFVRANPPLGARVNVVGTVNLFEALARRKAQIGRVVYASSVAVYDAADVAPGAVVQHDTASRPTSLYGVFKQANEGIARVYWHEQGVSSIGLRPAAVYGPGRDQGITAAPTLAIRAAARGERFEIPYGGRGELQYAADVAETFVACARAPFSGAEIFNLHGSVADMTEVVALIEAAAPAARGLITVGDAIFPAPESFDDGPLRALIGAPPHTPLAQGIAATVKLFRDQI